LGENWSGEATRGGGFRLDEQRVDVTIGDNMIVKKGEVRKEAPIWMRESTVDNEAATSSTDNIAGPVMMDEVLKTRFYCFFKYIQYSNM
jgi:transcription initiation factor TFIIE subunit alpha